jgi:hypothetical protein
VRFWWWFALSACELEPTAPGITGVSPSLACDDATTEIAVAGDGLSYAVVDALTDAPRLVSPTVTLTPASGLEAGSAPLTDRETVVSATAVRAARDGGLTVTVDPSLGLVPGAYDLTVGVASGDGATLAEAFLVAGPPLLSGALAGEVCQALVDAPIALVGEGFLSLDGALPTATVGGQPATVVGVGDCAPLAGEQLGEVCRRIDVTVDGTALPLGDVTVAVANPDPLACATEQTRTLAVVPAPTVDAVAPEATCNAAPATLVVTGTGFSPSMSVDIAGVAAAVTFIDDRTLWAVPGAGTPAGVQDVSVRAPSGCAAVLPAAVEIVDAPLVLSADPAVVWTGAAIRSRVLLADVVGAMTDAWLEDDAGARVDLGWTWDPASAATLDVDIPAGLVDGAYDLWVAQDGACVGVLPDAITATSALTLAVSGVSPGFAWTFDDTPVLVSADDPPPPGASSFAPTPRLWLLGPAPSVAATAVLGVGYSDPAALTAVLPAGLPVGSYDLLAVNPDGAVGLLPGAVTVSFDAPPRIDGATPPALPNSGAQTLTIAGKNFRDPSVALSCQEGGLVLPVAATVSSWTSTRIVASVPTGGLGQAVCTVTVTNADGAAVSWAAVSVTNPAQNLFPWQTGPSLVIPRRAPAAAAGRTTSVSRWIYVIGGDDGDPANALDQIEVASIGVYGDIGAFRLLEQRLPAPRTLAAAAVIGRFIYLVGGDDGAGPVDTVWRAQILDPLEVPTVTDIGASNGAGVGLGGGTWQWRVAAIYDPTDLSNPGGVGLPSEPVSLTLPDDPDKLQITLGWSPVDGAVGYRVYRSPVADAGPGAEEWLTDVTATAFTDVGDPVDPTVVPVPPGALGAWAALPPLPGPAASPCVAVAPDPFPDPDLRYLYAAGGFDPSGAALERLSFLDLQVVTDREQTPGSWTVLPEVLVDPRAECAGYGVDSALHSVVADGESWVYVAGGRDDGNGAFGTVEAGLVQPGGTLGGWGEIDNMSPGRAGFASAAASNFLYGFGGQNAGPSKSGVSGQLDPNALPDVFNWNSLGTSLSASRYLPGSAQESAVIVVIGGQTDMDSASDTVDWTNF